jgi:cell division septal protein FtsQ
MTRTAASTRSEAVRQRRTQHTQDKIQHARGVATGKVTPRKTRYAAETPTIFVRGGVSQPAYSRGGFSTPVVQRAQSRARRKVAIPLGSSGAEVVMPAMPIIHVGWRLISGIMVAGLVTLLILVWNMPIFQIDAPVVKGLERISGDDIQAVVNMEGQPIFLADRNQLQKDLGEAFPDLNNISVEVEFPNKVIITAVERQPVMAWIYAGDRTVWIDNQGSMFPARGELKDPILTVNADTAPPTAIDYDQLAAAAASQTDEPTDNTDQNNAAANDANIYQSKIDPNIQKVLIDLQNQMPENTTLVYNANEGFGWSDTDGLKVYIGQSLQDLNIKLNEYNAIKSKLQNDGVKPSMISVAYIDAPYYRLEQ